MHFISVHECIKCIIRGIIIQRNISRRYLPTWQSFVLLSLNKSFDQVEQLVIFISSLFTSASHLLTTFFVHLMILYQIMLDIFKSVYVINMSGNGRFTFYPSFILHLIYSDYSSNFMMKLPALYFKKIARYSSCFCQNLFAVKFREFYLLQLFVDILASPELNLIW